MKKIFFTIALILCFSNSYSQDYFLENTGPYNDDIKSPQEFLGYEIGFQHTRHDLILEYLKYLSDSSDKAQIMNYGKTHEGRKLVFLTISSTNNITTLEEIKKENIKFIKSGQLNKELPIIINLGYNVHGNEPSSSEAAMLTAYTLVD